MTCANFALGHPPVLHAVFQELSQLDSTHFWWPGDTIDNGDTITMRRLQFWVNLRLVSQQWNSVLMQTNKSGVPNAISFWSNSYKDSLLLCQHVLHREYTLYDEYLWDETKWFFDAAVLLERKNLDDLALFYETYLARCDSFKVEPRLFDRSIFNDYNSHLLEFAGNLRERDLIAFLRLWLRVENIRSPQDFERILRDCDCAHLVKALCYIVYPTDKHSCLDTIFYNFQADWYHDELDSMWSECLHNLAKGLFLGHFLSV